jgi:hypothetical protein
MQNYEEQVQKIREQVEAAFVKNAHNTVFIDWITPEDREHIIDIGVSILVTKKKIGPPGGSFVQAVCNNDLIGAFGCADRVNQRAINFYCLLIYNLA